ncbi:MAG TPA: hypothetical protein DCZ11_12395 [Gammaproteobacteria bacterium]|uniref:Lcl C-terminal domain-containing protein n=1 Tax=Immundisolibacter sp. TaxID=1934948 RepID=UPI000E923106|nr:hypothetical protein [Gammaproteobacteria bacterium]HCZ49785.1 hypothetical protein [Gammaproteobacteria bacterium]MCH79223.1 hypothetical protein [Gammaproteobacteria bacterium]
MAEGRSFWSSLPGILTALAGLLTALGGLLLAFRDSGLIGVSTPEPPAQPPGIEAAPDTGPAPLALRGVATTLTPERLARAFAQRGLFDRMLNPAGAGVANRFATELHGDDAIIRDAATGLVWQAGGSAGLTYAAAESALKTMNEQAYAGHRDWRLPTAEEAASLLEPVARNGRHIDPVFGSGVNFIWTADRSPDGRIYVAYWVDGGLSRERPAFHAWLKAVR